MTTAAAGRPADRPTDSWRSSCQRFITCHSLARSLTPSDSRLIFAENADGAATPHKRSLTGAEPTTAIYVRLTVRDVEYETVCGDGVELPS